MVQILFKKLGWKILINIVEQYSKRTFRENKAVNSSNYSSKKSGVKTQR